MTLPVVPTPLKPTGKTVAWNPRSHPLTRPPRLSYQNYTASRREDLSSSPRTSGFEEAKVTGGDLFGVMTPDNAKKAREATEVELGWIRTAESWAGDDASQPYGVTFHYNPTDIRMATNPNSDAIVGETISMENQDTSRLLGSFGTSTVSFDLYFNRIYDMNGSQKDYIAPLGKSPEGENHWEMLRKLGTQWDVEYLYRTINGKPFQDQMLSYKTADFGVVTARPVDVHLGPLAWRGTITSMTVNHIMFTPDFIPTFTTVSISLARQVTMGSPPDESADGGEEMTDEEKAAKAKAKAAEEKAKNDAKAAAAQKKAATQANPAKRNITPGAGPVALPG